LTLGGGLNRPRASETDPPSTLSWLSEPLQKDLQIVGEIELQLDAASTASDTAWIVVIQDIAPDGSASDITAGYLRASLREVDQASSRVGAPVLPCRKFEPVPLNQTVHYRIPLVPNARRFKAGHCVELKLTSDDQDPKFPALFGFRHASVGTSCLSSIFSSSRLLLSVVETLNVDINR
jgi:uncharacterized protein